jgi:hypothetical protein
MSCAVADRPQPAAPAADQQPDREPIFASGTGVAASSTRQNGGSSA